MVDTSMTQVAYTSPQQGQSAALDNEDNDKEFNLFGEDGLTFLDLVDMVNPLQHLPVVSTLYRSITGDEIDPGARLAGGTLYGGPIGLAASAFNVVLEYNTGKDAGEHVMALFEGDETESQPENTTTFAQNGPSPMVSGFAPVIPESEAAAMAAGEASLRLAELEEFMNPDMAREVPFSPMASQSFEKAAGSAGVWAPPLNQTHPFPTERPNEKPGRDLSYQGRPVVDTMQVTQTPVVNEQALSADQTQSYNGFQARQSHNDSLDALRAFARDVKAQELQQQAQQATTPAPVQPAPQPRPNRTSSLSQTSDNSWFADMMNQNLERYTPDQVGG